MNTVKQAYDEWSQQYDAVANRTRDMEGLALRELLADVPFRTVLEIGCGTGKNTEWFVAQGAQVTGVDLSPNMLAIAKEKVPSESATFYVADILKPWDFAGTGYDLVSFSLVLEHIENLENIFQKALASLNPGGHLYIGELHPFKQYLGSKARYTTAAGEQVVPCFTHHLSHFLQPALQFGFTIKEVREYFDGEDQAGPPRILALLLVKMDE